MNIFNTKDMYFEACKKSNDLHAMTEEERMKLQVQLRKMYIEIENVCDKHGLNMMLAYGSVIGALRHQGFIPWDDDIDLFMPRDDYDRLINLYAEELPQQYKIYSPNSKNGPIYRFAKIVDTNTRFLTPGLDEDSEKHGIFIDIFPLENCSQNIFAIKIERLKACFLMYLATSVAGFESRNVKLKNLMCFSLSGKFNYYFRNLLGWIFSYHKSEEWYNTFDRTVTGHPFTGFYNIPSAGASLRYFLPISYDMYIPAKKAKFDDIEAYIPNEAEKITEMEYGDWKRIPAENERWMHFIEGIKFDVK